MDIDSCEESRPPKPPAPEGSGLEYYAVPAPGWRVATGGKGGDCRYARPNRPGPDALACGAPASVEKNRPNDKIWPWFALCAEHARTHGRPDVRVRGVWAEGGEVLHWELRRADGTPATPQEIARVVHGHPKEPGKNAAHGPGGRRPRSFRERDDTMQDVEQAAVKARTSVGRWITEAIAARLGHARCQRCDARVPLDFGGLQGEALGQDLAEAVKRAENRQHPGHGPVRVGAGPDAPETPPGVIPFREPAVTR